MTRRSLSTLYQAELRREATGVDAEELLVLSTRENAHSTLLVRLATTPDAPALRDIALSIGPWSTAVATDLRRNQQCADGSRAPRLRKLAWVSLAAAAGLAVVVIGLQPRSGPDAPAQAMARPATTVVPDPGVDLLFADPDGSLVTAAFAIDGESIFADSVDM